MSLRPAIPLLLLLGMAACRSSESRAPVIGEAFAGPALLSIRQDIPLQSPVVATVKHGERLEIIQHRRRFMKVRTARGAEGWTEDHLLLSSGEIAALKDVERRALAMPSQGLASTYDMLNVHTEPNRLSPSFLQIKEGGKVDVIAHVESPRVPPVRQSLIPPRPRAVPGARKRAASKYPLPPMPAPPPLPKNWMELSKIPATPPDSDASSETDHPVPKDDWSLVRDSHGESGWVLTSRIYMAIPDEVAQYAEGHRITSYFSLGDVHDGDQLKHDWLWTTISSGGHPYDFDSFRVFTWSLRRHRYETAYIQRNVVGYFPVLTHPSGFSMCLDNGDGMRTRRTYSFVLTTVRLAGEEPCSASGNILAPGQAATHGDLPPHPPAPAVHPSLFARVRSLARNWFKR
ncbi:MAG TPA: SH3 domain-containing protein [Bryobacteraceae bacterium]|nr:SH3 domain-containing protein [Bryobacteraceae bacterium]